MCAFCAGGPQTWSSALLQVDVIASRLIYLFASIYKKRLDKYATGSVSCGNGVRTHSNHHFVVSSGLRCCDLNRFSDTSSG